MNATPHWLPGLVLFGDSGGNWDRYVDTLYGFFRKDFLDDVPEYQGTRVAVKQLPMEQSKVAGFWHLISEGKAEEDRLPDLRRCERIRWPRPIIEHHSEPVIKEWVNRRKGRERVCLWFEDVDYLVVLAVRKGYYLLWTAYPVTRPHTRRRLEKEYQAYKKANAAP